MSILLRGSFGLRARSTDGKWSQLFPLGKWHGANLAPVGGSIDLTASMLAEMVSNWKAAGSPSLPIYFHHPPPIDEVPPEKRKDVFRAAGHIEDLRVTATGVEAQIAWSAEGQKSVDGDEYRFISPEWQPRDRDRRTGESRGWTVTGAALTDTPFFHEMPRVAAAAPTRTKEQQMEFLTKVATLLGLAASSTEETVIASLTTLKGEAAPEKLTAAVKGATEPLELKLKAAQEEVVTLKAAADASGKERFAEQVAAAIKEAKLEGRAVDTLVATKMFKAATTIEDVRELLATATKGEVPLVAKGEPIKGDVALTAANARAKYDGLVAAEVAKGTKYVEAARLIAKAHPDVSALVFTAPATSTSTSST